MKITSNGQIALHYNEYKKTRNITFTELSCGHYIFPKLKRVTHLKKVTCPHCGNKSAMVMCDTTNQDFETLLNGR